MTPEQKQQLTELEAKVDSHLSSWQEAAKALYRIKSEGLFFGEWNQYVLDRFGLSLTHSYKYVNSGEVLIELGDSPALAKLLPSHCAEIHKVKAGENRKKLWDAVKGKKKLTAKDIEEQRRILFKEKKNDKEDDKEGTETKSSLDQLKQEWQQFSIKIEEQLEEIRIRREGGLLEVLAVPLGRTLLVILESGDSYRLHRYRYEEKDEFQGYRFRAVEDLTLEAAVKLIHEAVPSFGAPEFDVQLKEDEEDEEPIKGLEAA